jgi:hypothetical protein
MTVRLSALHANRALPPRNPAVLISVIDPLYKSKHILKLKTIYKSFGHGKYRWESGAISMFLSRSETLVQRAA